jgi:hypothetical protein
MHNWSTGRAKSGEPAASNDCISQAHTSTVGQGCVRVGCTSNIL